MQDAGEESASLRSTVYVEFMAKNNFTIVTEFILMGFTGYLKLEIPLFLVFLSFYLVTLLGNIGMIILIQEDVQLHTQCTECFLLAAMAYGRYVAISNPLLYTVVMQPRICWSLVLGAYVYGVARSILRTKCTFTLSFCDNNQINFFF
eukprot:bmy_21365T0